MWFKNFYLFRITDPSALVALSFQTLLATKPFAPPTASARRSAGWIAPASYAPDLLTVETRLAVLVALQVEEKLLPASAVKAAAAVRIAEIEKAEARLIYRREAKEIRERIAEELLPRALSQTKVLRALIDLKDGWIIVDTASSSKAELLCQLLRETLGSLPTRLVRTQLDPVTAMSTWLEYGPPERFTLDADAKLKAPGAGGAAVSVSRHNLESEEVKLHLKSGKLVTQLAMSWADKISFQINEQLQIKRIAMLDLIAEKAKEAGAEDAESLFNAHLVLQIDEARLMIADLMRALGGESAEHATAQAQPEVVPQ